MYDFESVDKRKFVFGNIFLLSNRVQNALDREMKDLTAKQWFVLFMLGMFEESPTLGEISQACSTSHQNIKQIMVKLEEKGFVKIRKDKNDMRIVRVSTTSKYRKWDLDHRESSSRFLDKMFKGLTNDQVFSMCDTQEIIFENLGKLEEPKEQQ